MVPQTFAEWRYCIEKQCEIPLTRVFAEDRLVILRDGNHEQTIALSKYYGVQHVEKLIAWFQIIADSHE